MKKIGAIILSGGKGERFGSHIPKQFVSLNGRPIISYCYETFSKHPDISYVVVASHEEWIGEVKKNCPNAIVVKGGATRQESSLNALLACDPDTDYILIHDAVRPFVDFKIINRCIRSLEEGSVAVDTIVPTYDTIVMVNDSKSIVEMPDRSLLYRGQTPQAFQYKEIMEAYLHPIVSDIPATDDIRYMFNKGKKCSCVMGSDYNIKITTTSDLYLAERLSQSISNISIGNDDLTGKKCLVFGATGGIGRAIVELLEDNGAKVIGVGSRDLDLQHFDQYDHFFREVRARIGMIDILINASGMLYKDELVNISSAKINEMLDINLKAAIQITRCAVLSLMKNGSVIFHIGSSSWSRGRKEYAVYSASKAALVNFVQAMSEELSPLGIKINCINPPRTNTEMRRKSFPGEDENTLMDPQVVAREILKYCNSHESGYVIDLKIGV